MNSYIAEYIGQKVLVQTNEQDSDLIVCKILRIEKLPNFSVVIFEKEDGKEFICGGMVFPDTPQFRKMLELASTMYPNVKEKFEFLRIFRNFDKDMDYWVKLSHRDKSS